MIPSLGFSADAFSLLSVVQPDFGARLLEDIAISHLNISMYWTIFYTVKEDC